MKKFIYFFLLIQFLNPFAIRAENFSSDNQMVLVPEGYFLMGISRDKIYLDKEVGIGVSGFPEHKVFLKSFYIDKYEASLKEYRDFVKFSGNKPPTIWMWNPTYSIGPDNHPVMGITWFDAEAYCQFKGKRLPTEEEWEKAARGTDARIYPWGNTFDPNKCNIFDSKVGKTRPVDSYAEGKSPYGVYNMCGNVEEWTASWYKPYSMEKPEEEKYKVLRGGGWESPLRPTASAFNRVYNTPEWAFSNYGVRCVKDEKEAGVRKKDKSPPLVKREKVISENDPVFIPAGEFVMGIEDNQYGWMISPAPAHKVFLDDYYLTRYEITNQEFSEFVAKTGAKEPPYWQQPKFNLAVQPVVGIDWFTAQSYCTWKGWRLPTEAQWEKAASWDAGKKQKYMYPWGEDENNLDKKMNFWGTEKKNERQPASVGSYKEGASPYGIYDMAGNVWEWVEDWYEKDYYLKSQEKNPSGPEKGEIKVLRGGSWGDYGPALKTINRGADYPQNYYSTYGIRCAKNKN